jgi:hypothetical protein
MRGLQVGGRRMAREVSVDKSDIPLRGCELVRQWEGKSCVAVWRASLMSDLPGCLRSIRHRSCGEVRNLDDGIGRGACALGLVTVAGVPKVSSGELERID